VTRPHPAKVTVTPGTGKTQNQQAGPCRYAGLQLKSDNTTQAQHKYTDFALSGLRLGVVWYSTHSIKKRRRDDLCHHQGLCAARWLASELDQRRPQCAALTPTPPEGSDQVSPPSPGSMVGCSTQAPHHTASTIHSTCNNHIPKYSMPVWPGP
jgi:hypothetical protein